MVSLSDIAKEVKFNVSVVSRALSENPDKHAVVKAETRELIQRTAMRMGYQPNRQASFNGRKRCATIYCFLPENADRLTADLMYGIVRTAGEENFPLKFYRGGSESDLSGFLLRMIDGIDHSGVITYPPFALTGSCAEMLRKYHEKRNTILLLNTPTNTRKGRVDAEFRAIPQVNIDEAYGGMLAAVHLLKQGCREFRYSYLEPMPYKSRIDGFRMALKRAGFTAEELRTPEDYRELANSTARTGIYADRDVHAFNMLIHLARVGITPGDRVLLVGNDDKQQSKYSLPRLSTVHQPTMEEGMLAVRKLIRMIFGGKEKTELVRPYLVVRESSGGGPDDEIIYGFPETTESKDGKLPQELI